MLVDLDTAGTDSIVAGARTITAEHFGARYISLRDEARFFDQIADFDGGLLVWPGGSLAERLVDRYGFEHHGLYNSAAYGDKPGLTELMAHANDTGQALSVILPTSRYVGDEELLRDEIWTFFEDLLAGEYGALPHRLIFEIGNEYYANFDGATDAAKAAAYGQIANIYGQEIARIDALSGGLPEGVEFSFQAGRSPESNLEILDQMGPEALSVVDMLSHHRFAPRTEAADKSVEDLDISMDQWADAMGVSDADAPGLFLSAYNVASLARGESADDYIDLMAKQGVTLTRDDLDLDGRSHAGFEEFYQAQLEARPVGIRHAEVLLEMYSHYSGLGIEAAGVYGWDLIHGGRSSLQGSDGESYVFAAGSLQDMMAESLIGTRVLDWYQTQDNLNDDRNEEATALYGFESDDKLVVFVSNPNVDGPFELRLALSDLGIDAQRVWGDRLTAEAPDNWQTLFNVPESPGVDQSGEAESYAVGIRDAFAPRVENGQLVLTVEEDQIVRLSFAKTEAGAQDIARWHEGPGTALTAADMAAPEQALFDFVTLSLADFDTDPEPAAAEEDGDDTGGWDFGWDTLLMALGLTLFGIV